MDEWVAVTCQFCETMIMVNEAEIDPESGRYTGISSCGNVECYQRLAGSKRTDWTDWVNVKNPKAIDKFERNRVFDLESCSGENNGHGKSKEVSDKQEIP